MSQAASLALRRHVQRFPSPRLLAALAAMGSLGIGLGLAVGPKFGARPYL